MPLTLRLLLLSLVASACGGHPPAAREPGPAAIGSPETFDVATWNVEQFGNDGAGPDDPQQLANVQWVIENADVDLWALQEIVDRDDFQLLMEALGEEWGAVLDVASTNLHVAFVFRTSVVRPLRTEGILGSFGRAFAGRPPLLLEAEVTLPEGTRTMTLINLHMKAFEDPTSYARRVQASERLKQYVDAVPLRDERVIVLGDFNDELGGSTRSGFASPYLNFVEDTADYRFATSAMEDDGRGTYCFTATCERSSAIDHILITNELFDAAQGDAVRHDLLLDALDPYRESTSDHLPAVFRLSY